MAEFIAVFFIAIVLCDHLLLAKWANNNQVERKNLAKTSTNKRIKHSKSSNFSAFFCLSQRWEHLYRPRREHFGILWSLIFYAIIFFSLSANFFYCLSNFSSFTLLASGRYCCLPNFIVKFPRGQTMNVLKHSETKNSRNPIHYICRIWLAAQQPITLKILDPILFSVFLMNPFQILWVLGIYEFNHPAPKKFRNKKLFVHWVRWTIGMSERDRAVSGGRKVQLSYCCFALPFFIYYCWAVACYLERAQRWRWSVLFAGGNKNITKFWGKMVMLTITTKCGKHRIKSYSIIM